MAPSSASMFLLHIHDQTELNKHLTRSFEMSCWLEMNDILNMFYLPASKVKRVASRP